MNLTQEYFDQVIQNLATKQDLERFATKDDLLELATTTELRALKDEIKDDTAEIKEVVHRIDQRADEDIKAVIKDVSDLKTRVRKLEHKAA